MTTNGYAKMEVGGSLKGAAILTKRNKRQSATATFHTGSSSLDVSLLLVLGCCLTLMGATGCKPSLGSVQRTNDPYVLAEIARETENMYVCRAALEKISDQEMIAKIALETKGYCNPHVAMEVLVHRVKQKNASRREETPANRTTEIEIMLPPRISQEILRPEQILLRAMPAFANLPEENLESFISEVWPVLQLFCDPDLIAHLGVITAMEIDWSPLSKNYYTTGGYHQVAAGSVSGEHITCLVAFSRTDPIKASWSSSFKPTIMMSYKPDAEDVHGFIRAEVDMLDLVNPALERLPQSTLEKIAFEGTDRDIRKAAVGKLEDQMLLAKIALKDEEVYFAVIEKLEDQALLGKFAMEEKDGVHRSAAVRRLTDQALLSVISVKDKDGRVREAAIEKLEDQALLGRIAIEDKEWYICQAAKKRLEKLRAASQSKTEVIP